jgi:fermentation-respiration switch protein FrsA (DUF1100 family)
MIFLYIFILLFFLYAIIGVSLYLFQGRMVYHPGNDIFRLPSEEGIDFEDLDLHTPDGLTLNAWYIPNKDAEKTVLFCHGNAGTLSSRMDTIKLFHEMGFSLFIFDYRGYGISEGTPSESGTYIDTETALNYMFEELNIPLHDIIIWGRSLGGPIAAEIAQNRKFYACVLESTFTSIIDMAKSRFKLFPSPLLARFHYATIDYIKNIKIPILIVHSPDDEIIPYQMGKRLFEAASEPKKFLQLHGDHNNTYFDSIDEYKKGLNEFFCSIPDPFI